MFFPLAVFPTSFSKGFSASPVSNTVPVIGPKQPNILTSQGAACNIRSKSTISHRNVTMMKAESFIKSPRNKEVPVLLRKISGKGQAFLYGHIISNSLRFVHCQYSYLSPARYFANRRLILPVGFKRSLKDASWFKLSMIRAMYLLMSTLI